MTKSENDGRNAASSVVRPLVQIGLPEDPLGYDTSDMDACARSMVAAALSGRNEVAVAAEIAAVRRRLGIRPEDAERRGP